MPLRRAIPCLLSTLLAAQAPAPPPAALPGRLPAAGLRADAALLRRAFEALHPGLHRYLTPAQVDAAFGALDRAFQRDRTPAEAFLAFSRLTAQLRCGHTYLNPSNQSKAVRAGLLEGPRIPFQFRWLGGRMIVTRSFAAAPSLAPGAEVLAVDGVPAPRLLAALMPYARADGHNDAKRLANLEVQGDEKVEAFDLFRRLIFPGSSGRIALRVRALDGTVAEVTVPALAPGDTAGAPPPLDKARPLWSLQWLDARTALLRMPTWAVYNAGRDWKADVQEVMAELVAKGATGFILDLRGNEGGLDVGNEILSHLTATGFAVPGLARWTRYRAVPEALRPDLDTWDRSFFDWGAAAQPLGNGFYRLTRYDDGPGGDRIPPAAPRYTGRLAVLVDAANSSATFQFAQVVQTLHLGALVGRPTGGNQRGINGGAFFFLRLPQSGLEVDLPLIGRFPPDGHPERLPDDGLHPDILVPLTQPDLAAGRDADRAAAEAWLAQP